MISNPAAVIRLSVAVMLLSGCNGAATNGEDEPLPSVWQHPAVIERQAVRIPLNQVAAVAWLNGATPAGSASEEIRALHAQQRDDLVENLQWLNLFSKWEVLGASSSQATLLRQGRTANARMALLLEPAEMLMREDGTARVAVRARLIDLQMDPPYPVWRRSVESIVGAPAATTELGLLKRAWWDVRGKLIAELLDWHDGIRRSFGGKATPE